MYFARNLTPSIQVIAVKTETARSMATIGDSAATKLKQAPCNF